jgi:hypothetical protein
VRAAAHKGGERDHGDHPHVESITATLLERTGPTLAIAGR